MRMGFIITGIDRDAVDSNPICRCGEKHATNTRYPMVITVIPSPFVVRGLLPDGARRGAEHAEDMKFSAALGQVARQCNQATSRHRNLGERCLFVKFSILIVNRGLG
jgi:hypothetical protein